MQNPIDATIQELEQLKRLLMSQVPASEPTVALSQEARAYKEALLTARVLTEKLRTLRRYRVSPNESSQGRCASCDGD
jgi:hypothetical protein